MSGRIVHLEDLVLEAGVNGISRVIAILKSVTDDSQKGAITLKMDGSPAIVVGRDDSGKFIFTDKAGFLAKGYNGKATSANELASVISSRKPVMDDARQKYVKNMAVAFTLYEKAIPLDFRGYLNGDLLYFGTPPVIDGKYEFQPNVVKYTVNVDSPIGKAIGNSKTAAVFHNYTGNQYKTVEDAVKQVNNPDILAIPPMYLQKPDNIDTSPIQKISQFANEHLADIKELFLPEKLRGIADIHQLMYRYINQKVDSGLEDLGSDFSQWINTAGLSKSKKAAIDAYLSDNSAGVRALWQLISMIMQYKEYLINEFDTRSAGFMQSIDGKVGGEGYVVQDSGGLVKLVARSNFTAANRIKNR